MPPNVRGHHSSINKAVNAHRQMVEERHSRQAYKKMEASQPTLGFNNGDIQVNGVSNDDAASNDENVQYMEHEMIDLASGPSKLGVVQAFQATEPGRPTIGEPVPKGTYLDVEG
jgi:hypothetical protein